MDSTLGLIHSGGYPSTLNNCRAESAGRRVKSKLAECGDYLRAQPRIECHYRIASQVIKSNSVESETCLAEKSINNAAIGWTRVGSPPRLRKVFSIDATALLEQFVYSGPYPRPSLVSLIERIAKAANSLFPVYAEKAEDLKDLSRLSECITDLVPSSQT